MLLLIICNYWVYIGVAIVSTSSIILILEQGRIRQAALNVHNISDISINSNSSADSHMHCYPNACSSSDFDDDKVESENNVFDEF